MKSQNFIIVCSFIFINLISCTEITEQPSRPPEINREMTVIIDGQEFEFKESFEPFSNLNGNTNCNSIFINTYIHPYGNKDYARLEFHFDNNGQLNKATLLENQEGSGPYAHFFSADYNPKKYLDISNFEFNAMTGDIRFFFEGKLFRHERGSLDSLRSIKGIISMESLIDVECSYRPHNIGIEYQADDFEFFSINSQVRRDHQNQYYEYKFRSNLGFEISIFNENDLWNYSEGTSFQFDNNNQSNMVQLSEYIGHPMTNRNNGLTETYWKKYETIGSYQIINKFEENDVQRIIGKINMDVYENGEFVFSIQEMTFSTEAYE